MTDHNCHDKTTNDVYSRTRADLEAQVIELKRSRSKAKAMLKDAKKMIRSHKKAHAALRSK